MKGFTLIELMIVLAILGILLAMVGPSLLALFHGGMFPACNESFCW